MMIDLEPELEAELAALAQRSGRTPKSPFYEFCGDSY